MYVYGKNVVNEVLKKEQKIYKAFILDNFDDEKIIMALKNKNIDIKSLNKKEFYKFDFKNHQGIILDIPDYEYSELSSILNKEDSFVLILDHLSDPHNFGAIIRTAVAAGVSAIIIPKDRSVSVNSTVMKISSGALNNISICMVTNLSDTIKILKKDGFWIVGTDMNGDRYDNIDMKGKIGVVIGSEGNGMTRIIKESCDFIASIPIIGDINSLNASVAAGIMMYEVVRQRK